CNKSSRMFETIQEQLMSFRHNDPNNIANANCNESTFGNEASNEDLVIMKQQMKKLVETCQTGLDDQVSRIAEDCSRHSDGAHTITTKNGRFFLARCEAGWLILAHRFDGSVDFNLDWAAYKQGFGDIMKEHFIGMDSIVSVLQQKRYKARFELTTWENETRYAEYKTFNINDENDKYRLNIDGYSGTAGDSTDWILCYIRIMFNSPQRNLITMVLVLLIVLSLIVDLIGMETVVMVHMTLSLANT
ncbi:unnamed protein product, partial [Owenia fusiformis]